MAGRERVLFVHINPEGVSFVQKDLALLSKHFDVREIVYRSRRDVLRVAGGTIWADATFSWFAWDQAAWATRFSRLFRRKSIVLVGGFDVVSMPEISYGNLLHSRPAARTKYAILKAHKVLAVSNSLKSDAERFTGRRDIQVVYHGFNAEEFKPSGSKEPIALSVGGVNKTTMKRKGIETFMKSAFHAPEVSFRLVGGIEPALLSEIKQSAPPNLELVGRVDQNTLIREMQRAAVYVQVSAHEGFGCSLAEAMLCGAMPVVTRAGAIPEVVGETGIYVPFEDPRATADGVRRALKSPNGGAARKRIAELFPIEKRERELVAAVREVLGESGGN